MVRLGNRTYRPENKTNPVNLVLVIVRWVELAKPNKILQT